MWNPTLIIGIDDLGERAMEACIAALPPPFDMLDLIGTVYLGLDGGGGLRAHGAGSLYLPSRQSQSLRPLGGLLREVVRDLTHPYRQERFRRRLAEATLRGSSAVVAPSGEGAGTHVHVVTFLGRRSGRGFLLDLCYLVREILAEPSSRLVLHLALPDAQDLMQRNEAREAYAQLLGLEYTTLAMEYELLDEVGASSDSGGRTDGPRRRKVSGHPFDQCWLLGPRNQRGESVRSIGDRAQIIGQALIFLITSPGADLLPWGAPQKEEEMSKPIAFTSYGIAVLELPRERLRRYFALRFTKDFWGWFLEHRAAAETVQAEAQGFFEQTLAAGRWPELLSNLPWEEAVARAFEPQRWGKRGPQDPLQLADRAESEARAAIARDWETRELLVVQQQSSIRGVLNGKVEDLLHSRDFLLDGTSRFLDESYQRLKEPISQQEARANDRRTHVERLQRRLLQHGVAQVDLDGHFDQELEQQVRHFQKQEGIEDAPGVVGPATWGRLKEECRPSLGWGLDEEGATRAQEAWRRRNALRDAWEDLRDLWPLHYKPRIAEQSRSFSTYLVGLVLLPWLVIVAFLPRLAGEATEATLPRLLALLLVYVSMAIMVDYIAWRATSGWSLSAADAPSFSSWAGARLLFYLAIGIVALLVALSVFLLGLPERELEGLWLRVGLSVTGLLFLFLSLTVFLNHLRVVIAAWYQWFRGVFFPLGQAFLILVFVLVVLPWLTIKYMMVPTFGNELRGILYEDRNENGLRDAEDPVLPGTRIVVTDQGGTMTAFALTDVGGNFRVGPLPAGAYQVRPLLPVGRQAGPGSRSPGYRVQMPPGSDGPLQIGVAPSRELSGRIGGVIYTDQNRNGRQDPGEAPVAGVPVVGLDPNGYVVAKSVTDAGGQYLLTGLASQLDGPVFRSGPQVGTLIEERLDEGARYAVVALTPAGFRRSDPVGARTIAPATLDLGLSPWPASAGTSAGPRLIPGSPTEPTTLIPGTGSVDGVVYLDENRNQVRDSGESGLAQVVISLEDQSTKAVLANSLTDERGRFSFVGVSSGRYLVTTSLPAGILGGGLRQVQIAEGQRAVLGFEAWPVFTPKMYLGPIAERLSRFLFPPLGLFLAALGVLVLGWNYGWYRAFRRYLEEQVQHRAETYRQFLHMVWIARLSFLRSETVLPVVLGARETLQRLSDEMTILKTKLSNIHEEMAQDQSRREKGLDAINRPARISLYSGNDLDWLYTESLKSLDENWTRESSTPDESRLWHAFLEKHKVLQGWRQQDTRSAAYRVQDEVNASLEEVSNWNLRDRFFGPDRDSPDGERFASLSQIIKDSSYPWLRPVNLPEFSERQATRLLDAAVGEEQIPRRFPQEVESITLVPSLHPDRVALFQAYPLLPLYALKDIQEAEDAYLELDGPDRRELHGRFPQWAEQVPLASQGLTGYPSRLSEPVLFLGLAKALGLVVRKQVGDKVGLWLEQEPPLFLFSEAVYRVESSYKDALRQAVLAERRSRGEKWSELAKKSIHDYLAQEDHHEAMAPGDEEKAQLEAYVRRLEGGDDYLKQGGA